MEGWMRLLLEGRAGGYLGKRVARAATADPQNVWQTIFTISGGLVLIKALIGVRTIIQAGGASTLQFQHSVGPTVLDAGTGVATANAVGTIYWLTGDVTDPVQLGAAGAPILTGKIVATSVTHAGIGVLAGAGNIQVTFTAAAGTGSTRYILCYEQIDPGASVVAA